MNQMLKQIFETDRGVAMASSLSPERVARREKALVFQEEWPGVEDQLVQKSRFRIQFLFLLPYTGFVNAL